MTGPKHLWSGNWEDESSSADGRGELPAASRVPGASSPPPERWTAQPTAGTRRPTPVPRPSRARGKRRGPARVALGLAVAVLVVAAAAVLISTVGGSSRDRTSLVSPAPAPRLAATTPPPASPPVEWLGMELVTVPPGGATVDTVKLGSEADRAGLSPGDVILAIDDHPVSGADGIAKAISGRQAGDEVRLQVGHGSSLYTTVVTLGASPTRYP